MYASIRLRTELKRETLLEQETHGLGFEDIQARAKRRGPPNRCVTAAFGLAFEAAACSY